MNRVLTAHPSFFETTVRHVGGLLSAYELSGFQHLVLLEKAEQVGNSWLMHLPGWATLSDRVFENLRAGDTQDNAIPHGAINFTDHTPVNATVSFDGDLALLLLMGLAVEPCWARYCTFFLPPRVTL